MHWGVWKGGREPANNTGLAAGNEARESSENGRDSDLIGCPDRRM